MKLLAPSICLNNNKILYRSQHRAKTSILRTYICIKSLVSTMLLRYKDMKRITVYKMILKFILFLIVTYSLVTREELE